MPEHDFTPRRIRQIHDATGLDHTNFAAAIGVSRVSIWRYEIGLSSPRNELIIEQLMHYEQAMLRASQSQEDE